MKSVMLLMALAVSTCAIGQPLMLSPTASPTPEDQVEVARVPAGSGEPEQTGFENAVLVGNNMYHAPQFMPGYPTAATIWPRVIEIPCRRDGENVIQCEGYHWVPSMGRGEYLYFVPVVLRPSVSSTLEGPQPIALAP